MASDKPAVVKTAEERIPAGQYISEQYNGMVHAKTYQDHKTRIQDNDSLYDGDLSRLFPEDDLPDTPLVENKFKNSLHDIMRLATDAKPTVNFFPLGDDKKSYREARVKESAADTFWFMSGAKRLERKIYMDLVGAGMAALAVFYNDESEYPQVLRLDPRYCYPDVRNGKLVNMLYAETMPLRLAEKEFDVSFPDAKKDEDVTILTYYDDEAVSTVVARASSNGVKDAQVAATWVHGLKCVPVAYEQLDTFDSSFRGMLDQLGGPMMIRNKIISLLSDYMEDMVHASYEMKNILNADDLPGPLRIFQHDPNAEESFVRRVAPAAPAGQVFGLLQYMDTQEAREGLQPPARVGTVTQSIASGSFVASTQGNLSSAVKEVQELLGNIRVDADYIAFKIDKKYLDHEKPLMRAVAGKSMYTPSKDLGERWMHRVLFGAAAGVGTQYADNRLMLFQGAGFISKQTARNQIDFLDDQASEQDLIDSEELMNILKQRFAADPRAPLSVLAKAIVAVSKGDDMIDVLEDSIAKLEESEQAQMQQGQGPEGEMQQTGPKTPSQGPGTPATEFAPIEFAPAPLQQQIVSNR